MSTYIQIYTATDMYSSTSVTRTVTVRRSVLKLIFPEWHEYRIDWLNTMYTQVNKPFVDPGYIITDSSVLLSIVGNVNTSIPGAYKLVYTTIDSSSVTSIVSRYVIVTDTGFISFSPLQNDPSDPSYIYSNNGGSAIIFDNSARATNGATAQNAFAFGFRGYGITKSYDPTFDYNGTWSIMIKFRSVLFSLFNFDFDNYYNSAGNAPGGIPLHTIYFKGISNGAEIGGPEYTTVYYTTFPMIVSYVAIGVYIVLNRISNYNIFKIYNLAGVLLCDVTSKVPFAYTKKQQIFSITNINATEPRYFTSFGAGIYYKKTELFPSDWNPVILVGTYVDGNRPLYYSLL